MKRLVYVLIVLALLLSLSACVKEYLPSQEEESSCSISADYSSFWGTGKAVNVTSADVVDGDTFRLNKEKYRIIGIDTPEVHEGSKPIGMYGEEAEEYFKWFADKFSERYIYEGKDDYGRDLIYLFSSDGSDVYFYEASVTAAGLARPLVYKENAIPELINAIIKAYRCAWENRRGIFSLWDSALILKKGDEWKDKIGKIVWIEDTIEKVYETDDLYIAKGEYSSFIARRDGYEYMFDDFDFYNLKGHKVKVYGELWEYNGHPEIMVRAPFEIVFEH